jgi:uncharacterized protein
MAMELPEYFTPRWIEARCVAALANSGGDAAHDLDHVRRVVAVAERLARQEGADLRIVRPAAWLHDCVSIAKGSPERARASRHAARQAEHWLLEWGFPHELIPAVAHAIEAHSFSAGIAPRTPEARVVQDADRLDALGAVGLARCLMLGGQLGRPLYAPDDPFCERRAPDDSAACVDHFHTKLLRLQDSMQTAAGRSEAVQRTAFLRSFLDQLRSEIGVH